MLIRKFETKDAAETSELVRTTMRVSNEKEYTTKHLEAMMMHYTLEGVIEKSRWMHFYVAEENGVLIGCGGIGPCWGSVVESGIYTLFVLPEHQRNGVGRELMRSLENDEFYLRANRIEVPSSVSAVEFFLKMGYDLMKDGNDPDDEQVVKLEKLR